MRGWLQVLQISSSHTPFIQISFAKCCDLSVLVSYAFELSVSLSVCLSLCKVLQFPAGACCQVDIACKMEAANRPSAMEIKV